MKTMTTNISLWLALCLCGTAGLTACSHDDGIHDNSGKTAQQLEFYFTEENFGEDEPLTRAGTDRTEQATRPQTVDLGDCEAEITIESELAGKSNGASPKTGNANTRAITGPKHYTIRIYEHSSHTYKGEFKGNFNGTTFIPDPATAKHLYLPHGHYDFVAYNDKVTLTTGGELQVTRADAETAMMGIAENVHINQDPKQKVAISTKHVGCRLRTQIVCQKHIPASITSSIEAVGTDVPVSVTYSPATLSYTGTNGAITAEPNNSPASTQAWYTASGYGASYAYTSTAGYHYFLPTTQGAKLQLTNLAAGTLFWKPLTVPNLKLETALVMEANKSYLVKIKIKPKWTYLMSNGDTGPFSETIQGGGTKKAVGLVVDSDRKIAIALKNTPGDNVYNAINSSNSEVCDARYSKTPFSTVPSMLANYSGYEETWEANTSFDNTTVKGNSSLLTTFRVAGQYAFPGVPLTGTLTGIKWYLPAMGELKEVFARLGFGDTAALVSYTNWSLVKGFPWYGYLTYTAFHQVGGDRIDNKSFYTADEYYNSFMGKYVTGIVSFKLQQASFSNQRRTEGHAGFVRPFIKY